MRFGFKVSSATALLLALLSGGALFWVSQQVQQGEREQRRLQHIIAQEGEAIRVLNAEWDYLNRPDRLEALAADYLKMEPAKADSLLLNVSSIPEPAQMPGMKEKPIFVSTRAPEVKPSPVAHGPAQPVGKMPMDEPEFERLLDSLQQEGQ
jgi:hypothetical protein